MRDSEEGNKSESYVLKKVMLAASKLGMTVFRNQVGQYQLKDGRYIRSGLFVGSPDLVGWNRSGKFVGIEVKAPGKKPSKEQAQFLENINRSGGIGLVVDNADNLKKLLDEHPNCI